MPNQQCQSTEGKSTENARDAKVEREICKLICVEIGH